MLVKIRNHFKKVDPILFSSIRELYLLEKVSPNEYFEKLCGEIINQQLSDKASSTIFAKFKKLYPQGKITPQHTLKLEYDQIRKAGPSNSKVKFIKGLAQKVVSEELKLEKLENLTDEEVMIQLTQVKGIGPWTAEMFMMFSLGRPNLFSYGDLGLKKAIKKLYKFNKDPTQKQMEKIVDKWSPYKSYACIILWQVLDG
ncbi:DNA-3-methyladenine glycosylase 2 family protein [Candidatus Gottesmanbacteria bacterium]|nr:DNA-3-methyladenine glycosylase 2 family protein [Candidatus Gottesmanbacteria bacterium]